MVTKRSSTIRAVRFMESELGDELDGISRSITKRFADAKEAYLLKFFGSYENAKAVAHLYVFEETDFDIQLSEDDDTYKVGYSYRVRPKTPEELAADEARKTETASTPRDEHDIHEWTLVSFNYASWLECLCGFRPQSQEDMDAHVPPKKESTHE